MSIKQSRVPPMPGATRDIIQFHDSVDRRQQQLAELELLPDSAVTADLIAKINAIINSHK